MCKIKILKSEHFGKEQRLENKVIELTKNDDTHKNDLKLYKEEYDKTINILKESIVDQESKVNNLNEKLIHINKINMEYEKNYKKLENKIS